MKPFLSAIALFAVCLATAIPARACPLGYDIAISLNLEGSAATVKPDEVATNMMPPFKWAASTADKQSGIEISVAKPEASAANVWRTRLTRRGHAEIRYLEIDFELPESFIRHLHIAYDKATGDIWTIQIDNRCAAVDQS